MGLGEGCLNMNEDSESTAVEVGTRVREQALAERQPSEPSFDEQWREAKVFANSSLCPEAHRGSPENCLIIAGLARSMKIPAIQALTQIGIVKGKPFMQVELQSALVNRSGLFKGMVRVKVEGTGRDMSATAYAIDAATGEELTGPTVTMAMAEADGWTRNPKYKSIPSLMLSYRAKSFFFRMYCPEITMGLVTPDEAIDAHHSESAPRYVSPEADDVHRRLTAGAEEEPSRVVEVEASESDAEEQCEEEHVNDWDV